MKRLLDTDTCVYITKQKPPQVLERFRALASAELGISSITVAELMYGVQKSQHPAQNLNVLEQLLRPLFMADVGYAVANVYGQVRSAWESQ